MKKSRNVLAYVFFTFFLSHMCYSQSLFNVKLGASLANQTNVAGDFKLGVNAGISYEYQFSDLIWVDVGLDYIEKGANLGSVLNVTQFSTRISYIEVPVYVKYRYLVRDHFNWALYAGPSFGYVLTASNRFFRVAQPVFIDLPRDGSNGAVTAIDPAINVGGELNFGTEYGYMGLFSNFQYSMTTAIRDENGNSARNFGLVVGLKFQFGKPLTLKDF